MRLQYALRRGHDHFIIKWLKDGGRNHVADKPCLEGTWILTAAAAHGRPLIVERLLKAKAKPDPPDDGRGNFPLLASCSSGSELCVRLLLDHSADSQRKTSDGRTALRQAHLADREGGVRMLTEHEEKSALEAQNASVSDDLLRKVLADTSDARDAPDADLEALATTLEKDIHRFSCRQPKNARSGQDPLCRAEAGGQEGAG